MSYLDDGGTPESGGDDLWLTYTEQDGLPGSSIGTIVVETPALLTIGATDGALARFLDGGTPLDKSDDAYELLEVYGVQAVAPSDDGMWAVSSYGVSYLFFDITQLSY